MKQIRNCRICGGSDFEPIVDLGWQALTGFFPRDPDIDKFPGGPLRLIQCVSEDGCGLVQLEHSFDQKQMYGENYGYRSGLNSSMIQHLQRKVVDILSRLELSENDVVLDIGSNDGTTLGFYSSNLTRVGIDPTASKFRSYYPPGVLVISDFFSADAVLAATKGRRARAITSISMMYDLEQPQNFVDEVTKVLAHDGIWVFEQSYLPLMLERNAFDTICHEHLEYYGIRQIDWLLRNSGLQIIDIELNDVNGGSFSVTASHNGVFAVAESVALFRRQEESLWANSRQRFSDFAEATRRSVESLNAFVQAQITSGRSIAGLGASTKGNVLLQFAGLTASDISVIGDVNSDKYGCVTPGSWIPIKSQDEVLSHRYDSYLVLPWHFRSFFETSPTFLNCQLVFPLPQLLVVSR